MPLQDYERVLAAVPALALPLLHIHVLEMEAKLQPGCQHISWASMNIDGFLHYARKVLQLLLVN